MNAQSNDTQKDKGLSSSIILLAAICLLAGCSTIDVSSTPSGARVFVNDTDTGKTTPTSIKVRHLPLGRASITVEKEGYQSVPPKQEIETGISVGNIVWSVIWPPVVIKNLCDNFWKGITYPHRGRLEKFVLQPVSGAPSATTSVQSEIPVTPLPEPPKRTLITNTDVNAKSGESDGGIVGAIPPGSKFAKISIGMSMKEVFDFIGPPTDTKAYATGKTFIPFYFGSDGARSEALYKGEGRITFTGGAGVGGGTFKVYRIVYDPSESGYNR